MTVPESSVVGAVRDCDTFWARLGSVAAKVAVLTCCIGTLVRSTPPYV